GAGAEVVPDDDENDGDEKDESGDGVDFRGDATPEAAPDFLRECVVAADKEEGDGDFVHGEREDEQASGDERETKIRKRYVPEGAPGSCAEVERGFFLAAVEFLKACEDFRGGDGDERCAVTEEDGGEAAAESCGDGEH